jgi:hypothetical protein
MPLRHRSPGWDRTVDGGDRVRQLRPLPPAHLPEFGLVEHANTPFSNGNDPLVPLFPDCPLTILRESARLVADRLYV